MTTLTQAELLELKPFLYHTVDAATQEEMSLLRADFLRQALHILRGQPSSRSHSLALTHLEEAQMRAIQGLALRGTPQLPQGFRISDETAPEPAQGEPLIHTRGKD